MEVLPHASGQPEEYYATKCGQTLRSNTNKGYEKIYLFPRWRGVVGGLRAKRNNGDEPACREERKYDSDKSILSCGGDHEGENGYKHQYLAKQYLAKSVGLKSLHPGLFSLTAHALNLRAARLPMRAARNIFCRRSAFSAPILAREYVRLCAAAVSARE